VQSTFLKQHNSMQLNFLIIKIKCHHFEDTKGVMAERIGTKGQTTIYKAQRGKIKFEQHEPH
jgi:hypothetical protein